MHRTRNRNCYRLAWLAVAAALMWAVVYGLYKNHSAATAGAYRGVTLSDSGVISKEIFTGAHQALAQTELLAELKTLTADAEDNYGLSVLELDT